MSVLVVEDEVFINLHACEYLRDQGHTVWSAANADIALTQLEGENDIGVMFTDIDMPGSMNGVALAEQVAARWPYIRIIITSGKSRPAVMPRDSHFLPKPYRLGEVNDLSSIKQ